MLNVKTNVPQTSADNDVEYLDFVLGAIKHSDPNAAVVISKHNNNVTVIVTPSDKKFKQDVITDVLEANHRLGLVIRFSKSLKISKSIHYVIDSFK